MKIQQFVIAYGIEQDRIRALLPDGFISLRPVLRINAEIRDGKTGYAEFNTAVEKDNKRGWLNIGLWEDMSFEISGKSVTFSNEFLEITFTGVGIEGGCPAEKDNDGCFFADGSFRISEKISSNKEFCDFSFCWKFGENSAHGVSVGKTLPAVFSEEKRIYPKLPLTVENAACIPCEQVLGSYMVLFER